MRPMNLRAVTNFLLFAGMISAALFAAASPATAAGPEISGPMQNFKLETQSRSRVDLEWKDGTEEIVTLGDFKGKVVLLNFWATWCAPCLRELPSLGRLQASLGGQDFVVVALNIDRKGGPVAKRMLRRLRIKNLDLYLDKKAIAAKALGVVTMPTTFLFDAKGRQLGKLVGAAEWDDEDAVKLVKYFIENPGYADKLPPFKLK